MQFYLAIPINAPTETLTSRREYAEALVELARNDTHRWTGLWVRTNNAAGLVYIACHNGTVAKMIVGELVVTDMAKHLTAHLRLLVKEVDCTKYPDHIRSQLKPESVGDVCSCNGFAKGRIYFVAIGHNGNVWSHSTTRDALARKMGDAPYTVRVGTRILDPGRSSSYTWILSKATH